MTADQLSATISVAVWGVAIWGMLVVAGIPMAMWLGRRLEGQTKPPRESYSDLVADLDRQVRAQQRREQ